MSYFFFYFKWSIYILSTSKVTFIKCIKYSRILFKETYIVSCLDLISKQWLSPRSMYLFIILKKLNLYDCQKTLFRKTPCKRKVIQILNIYFLIFFLPFFCKHMINTLIDTYKYEKTINKMKILLYLFYLFYFFYNTIQNRYFNIHFYFLRT